MLNRIDQYLTPESRKAINTVRQTAVIGKALVERYKEGEKFCLCDIDNLEGLIKRSVREYVVACLQQYEGNKILVMKKSEMINYVNGLYEPLQEPVKQYVRNNWRNRPGMVSFKSNSDKGKAEISHIRQFLKTRKPLMVVNGQ